jgi:AcrR family transcriptional regulator
MMPVTHSPDVQARRPYNSARRRAAAAGNRRAVLDACRDLLLRDGYRATTIRAVAERAAVSQDTIYKTFGSKQQLMKAVYDVTVAGDDEPVPIGQRPPVQRVLKAPDPTEKIRLYAEFVRGFMQRLGGLVAVLAEADPEIAEIRAVTEAERLAGVRAFVGHLAGEGHLTSALDQDQAADACWSLTSPQLFAQLTQARAWTPDSYQGWLAQMLSATLLGASLPDGPPPHRKQ